MLMSTFRSRAGRRAVGVSFSIGALLIALLAASPSSSRAATYHVATDGDDGRMDMMHVAIMAPRRPANTPCYTDSSLLRHCERSSQQQQA